MKVSLCIIATLAAFSTAAVAQDIKQDQKAPAPTVQATVMSDSEMDKVTAGAGFGTDTAAPHAEGPTHGISQHAISNAQSPGQPGFGNCTAGHAIC
jgi:hypothetical protein